MPGLDQGARPYKISTPLGEGALYLYAFNGTEALSQCYEFDLELLSEDAGISFADIVGKNITVSIELDDGEMRFLNGVVNQFSQEGSSELHTTYRMTVVPWLWFLTRSSNCRVFQDKTVPEIVKFVFGDLGFTDFEERLSASYRTWHYCVQYRETDFNFVSRLMEQEGIYYYFKHEDGKHTLVLSDSLGSHDPFGGYEEIPYAPARDIQDREGIQDWMSKMNVTSGKATLQDYNFETPSADLETISDAPKQHEHADMALYDYPGEYSVKGEGDHYVRVRMEEAQALHEVCTGTANCRGIATGSLFSFANYFLREDQNREYLVLRTACSFSNTEPETQPGTAEKFACQFEVIPSSTPCRPPRIARKPVVHGNQTAVVIGAEGEEIDVDEYGRVLVRFHWGEEGGGDQPGNSSCRVRVAQPWGGKGWGYQFFPRVGDEVLVSFLEGDPDQPLIAGSVYNAENMPKYAVPDNKTQSGIKTKSSKGATDDNYNELRFEDKLGEEHIYMHAEKDFERVVENNDTLTVGVPDVNTPTDGDQTLTIFNNQELTIGDAAAKDGSQTVTIKKDRTTTLKEGNDVCQVKLGNQDVKVDAGDQSTKVAKNIKIEAGLSIELKVGGSTVKMDPTSITLETGPSKIKMDPAGVTIDGVTLNASGTATADLKSPMTTVKGDGMLTLKGGITMIN